MRNSETFERLGFAGLDNHTPTPRKFSYIFFMIACAQESGIKHFFGCQPSASRFLALVSQVNFQHFLIVSVSFL